MGSKSNTPQLLSEKIDKDCPRCFQREALEEGDI